MSPYWMVLINIIASFLLLLGIITYRYIYPKKNVNLFILLLLISILPIISIFRTGAYQSGDFQTHVMEEISFYHLLSQGEIFPLWGGDMNATYGYPSFHFTYPLPFYIMALFHWLGFSFIMSIKIFLAATFIFSGIFMYLWLKKEVSEKAAVVGVIFYLFAPYHLIDLHFRADVGEVLAFVFLPLCLLSAKNFLQKKSLKWFIFETLSFSALLLSHPALSLVGFVILCLYISIFITQQKREKIRLFFLELVSIVSAVLLTAFYWLPILLEIQYTLLNKYRYANPVSFLSINELMYSTWRFGLLFQGPHGELAFIIGYTQILIIICALLFLIKRKLNNNNERKLLIASVGIVFVTIFLMLSISKPVWFTIPLLKSFQYAYRLQGVLLFAISVSAAIITNNVKKNWFIILICLITIFSTILNWGNRNTIPQITDEVLQKQVAMLGAHGSPLAQAITYWSDAINPWAKKIPSHHTEILKGSGTIKELSRNNISHIYLVDAHTRLLIRENTVYFPGWNVLIDYQPQQINILTQTTPKGLISFTVPMGLHKVEVFFKDTLAVSVGKIISGTFLIIWILILGFFVFTKSKRFKSENMK